MTDRTKLWLFAVACFAVAIGLPPILDAGDRINDPQTFITEHTMEIACHAYTEINYVDGPLGWWQYAGSPWWTGTSRVIIRPSSIRLQAQWLDTPDCAACFEREECRSCLNTVMGWKFDIPVQIDVVPFDDPRVGDADNDIDLHDLAVFLASMTGPIEPWTIGAPDED